MASQPKNWLEGLKSFEISQVLDPDFILFQLEKTASIPEVLSELTRRGLQCLPIYDSEKQMYAGLVDALDLVCLVVLMDTFKGVVDVVSHEPVSWEDYCAQERLIFSHQTAGEICNASERNDWRPVQLTDSINDVLKLFALPTALHRAPVIDSDNFLHGLITQSSLACWLGDALRLLSSPVLDRKIAGCGSKEVLAISSKSTAIEGFKVMFDSNASGLAVIDDESGKLVACLSASDIKRCTGFSLFSDVHKPVLEFLQIGADKLPHSTHPVTLTEDQTFGELFTLIQTTRVHRVFVVDEAGRPVSTISLTDLLGYLATTE